VPGKPKNSRPRKLASILTRVLDWVRSGDYEDHDLYMLFGTPDELSDEVKAGCDTASKALQQYVSRVRANRRTTLNRDPDLEAQLRKAGLTETGRKFVEVVLGGRDPNEVKLPKRGPEAPTTTREIEQHFADELVTKSVSSEVH